MNIILVIIDTLRYDYIGANGNTWIQTPNLDRMAAESWVFLNSYTSSYPTIPHRTDVITGDYGKPFHAWVPLPFNVPTLPDALAAEGYCTQLIHDTPHLVNGGHNFDFPFHAWSFIRGQGADRGWIADPISMPDDWNRDPLFDAQPDAPPPPEFPFPADIFLDSYLWTNRGRKKYEDWSCAKLFLAARDFVKDNKSRDNFFLWVDCFDPHEPWDVPAEFMLKYDRTPGFDGRVDPRVFGDWRESRLTPPAHKRVQAMYAAKVTWVDHWFGFLLDALEETGLNKNTALLVTSDHGTNVGGPYGYGKKQVVREGEAHTPLMIRVPGGGSGTSDIIVQPQDIFATVMGIAGGKTPDHLDSHDILRVAREQGAGSRNIAVAGWPPDKQQFLLTAFDGEWCLELSLKTKDCRLVKMGETEDCASGHPDVVKRLRKAALDEYERRGTDPKIMRWLRSEGKMPILGRPVPHRFFPPPPGYRFFFDRLYADKVHAGNQGKNSN